MKKIALLMCTMIASTLSVHADFVEKFFDEEQIPVEEAVSHFNEWFATGESEFVLFFDETDALGMRDMDYQQFINGVKVENSALYVHSRNGFVTLINGDIMPIAKEPSSESHISPRRAIQIATEQDTVSIAPQKMIIHIQNEQGEFNYYTVFKIETDIEDIYVNCSTGEIVQSISKIHNISSCTVNTKYNGLQDLYCSTSTNTGNYLLYNEVTGVTTGYGYINGNNTSSIPSDLYHFSNSTTNWNAYYLTSVTVSAVHNSWWNTLFGDSNPDLYIRIKDANGNLLYISDYKEDCGLDTPFPVTFRISTMVRVPAEGGITIEIWDEDFGDDEKGNTITISNRSFGALTWGTSSSDTEGSIILSPWHPAMDVQWGLDKTWNFYYEKFGLFSFDGNHAATRAVLHSPMSVDNIGAEAVDNIFNTKAVTPRNAYAISQEGNPGGAYMYFGLGNEKGDCLVDLNTVSHEFTHLVTAYRPKGDLVYQGESGAINEGYSDAFAVTIEADFRGEVNWLYGHDVQRVGYDGRIYDYCRNLADPMAGGPEGLKPDTYGGENWISPTSSTDKGGVHVNNSIFTYWYYLLCEGGRGINYNAQMYSVNKIGMDKALQIAWRMHRTYLPPQATFAQARQWAIQSAIDLYGKDSPEYQSVMNAWYAVGVGEKYVAPVIENLCIEDFFERVAFLEKPADLGNNIYCYIWIDGTATQVTGAWPGKRATDLGDNYYKYIIPSSAESINENWRIIWHDGTGKQTEDLVYENQGLYTGLSYSMVEFNRYISNICDPSPVPEIHVDEATPSANARKIIKDGNLYILHGDDIYNAQGERIK